MELEPTDLEGSQSIRTQVNRLYECTYLYPIQHKNKPPLVWSNTCMVNPFLSLWRMWINAYSLEGGVDGDLEDTHRWINGSTMKDGVVKGDLEGTQST